MSDDNLKINGQPMLVHNWQQVLKRAWSVRFIVIAGLLSGFEVALPLLPLPIPAGVFAALSAFSTAAAFVARLMVQSKVSEANDADQ